MDVLVELAAPKAARNPASVDPAPAVSSHGDVGLDQIGKLAIGLGRDGKLDGQKYKKAGRHGGDLFGRMGGCRGP